MEEEVFRVRGKVKNIIFTKRQNLAFSPPESFRYEIILTTEIKRLHSVYTDYNCVATAITITSKPMLNI